MLRVPVATFGDAMDALEQLGTVVHSSSSGTDVTTQVIDVQQRLRTLRISLRDLNSFQRHAATIDQLLRFENAITQRRGAVPVAQGAARPPGEPDQHVHDRPRRLGPAGTRRARPSTAVTPGS